jgi:ABC-type transport system involved in cytochrome c biogenesis permease subunit
MKNLSTLFPWIVVLAAGLYLGYKAQPARDAEGEMRLNDLGQLPLFDDGRNKPFDSMARIKILILSRRQTFEDDKGKMQPAIKWLLDVMASADASLVPIAKEKKIFRIEEPKLLSFLGLEPKTESNFYAIGDFASKFREFSEVAEKIRELPSEQRSSYELAVLDLDAKIHAFVDDLRAEPIAMKYKIFRIVNDQVLNLLSLKARPGSYRYALNEFEAKLEKLEKEADRARKVESNDRDVFDREVLDLQQHIQSYIALARGTVPLISPPDSSASDAWLPLGKALLLAEASRKENKLARSFGEMLWAYRKGDAESFNRELATYREEITKQKPSEVKKAKFEAYFNHFEPFYQCTLLYVGVFLLTCLSWVFWTESFNRSAFFLALLTLLLQAAALFARMYIQNRYFVFVTNLYSTAVFIGWVCIITGLTLEVLFRNGIGMVVGSIGGAVTALISHHLAEESGDTMGQLVAVLDTNIWLATHVTIVNIGYAATMIAGLIGALFILRGVATPSLDQKAVKTLGQMMYGTLCFATLFSFTGTVLGGIWADQSWGRFWGWDPKENGAVLIVIWNALILHARWGGMVKQRGMAVLSIVGGMITGWSWFGTNQLSVGLHAYGFSKELADGLVLFWGSQLVLIAIGLLPASLWWSNIAQASAAQQARIQKKKERRPIKEEGIKSVSR